MKKTVAKRGLSTETENAFQMEIPMKINPLRKQIKTPILIPTKKRSNRGKRLSPTYRIALVTTDLFLVFQTFRLNIQTIRGSFVLEARPGHFKTVVMYGRIGLFFTGIAMTMQKHMAFFFLIIQQKLLFFYLVIAFGLELVTTK